MQVTITFVYVSNHLHIFVLKGGSCNVITNKELIVLHISV